MIKGIEIIGSTNPDFEKGDFVISSITGLIAFVSGFNGDNFSGMVLEPGNFTNVESGDYKDNFVIASFIKLDKDILIKNSK